MSYCVSCGVKLSSSENKCPLCKTPVINPNIKNLNVECAYPDRIDSIKNFKINWKFLVKLSTLILLLLSIITVVCDLLLSGSITWSLYVVGSASYIGCLLSFLYFKNIIISLIIGVLSTELFLLMIALLNRGLGWYLHFAMPYMFLFGIFAILFTLLIRRKNKSILRIISFCLLFISLVVLSIESLIDLYIDKNITLNWSIYVVLPLIVLSILIIILSFNRKLIEEIKQRVFI